MEFGASPVSIVSSHSPVVRVGLIPASAIALSAGWVRGELSLWWDRRRPAGPCPSTATRLAI
jgi:hypothetical protein